MAEKKRKKKKKKRRKVRSEKRYGENSIREIIATQLSGLSEREREIALKALRAEFSDDIVDDALAILYDPDYKSRPVSIEQYLEDPYYLGWDDIYDVWKNELNDLFHPANKYQEWILGGCIGGGKTTAAVRAFTYIIYRYSRLRDPHAFYGLSAASLTVFGIYSVTKIQAQDVAFGKIRFMLENIPYFKKRFPVVERIKRVIRFSRYKRAQVISGSKEFHAIGMDLFAFLLDEGNFFQGPGKKSSLKEIKENVTEALKIYNNALRRIRSRFMQTGGGFPGMVFLISSKGNENAFLEEHIRNAEDRIRSGEVKLTEFAIWEVKPSHLFIKPKFRVQVGDATFESYILREDEEPRNPAKVIEVPGEYYEDFVIDCEQALRDHAGISTTGVSALIKDREAIVECISDEIRHPFGRQSIKLDYRTRDRLEDYFLAEQLFVVRNSRYYPRFHPQSGRFVHVDIALSNDAAGLAIGHVGEFRRVKRMREDRMTYYEDVVPIIWIDLMLQILPPGKGGEIGIDKIRQFIVNLRDMGLPILSVSADGYQSAGMLQILGSLDLPFATARLSVDRNDDPYCELRNAILERRIVYYQYDPFLKEVRNLIHDIDKRKVDHPENNPDGSKGSKDVSDAVAAVVYQCMQQPLTITNLDSEPVPLHVLAKQHGLEPNPENLGEKLLKRAGEMARVHSLRRRREDV